MCVRWVGPGPCTPLGPTPPDWFFPIGPDHFTWFGLVWFVYLNVLPGHSRGSEEPKVPGRAWESLSSFGCTPALSEEGMLSCDTSASMTSRWVGDGWGMGGQTFSFLNPKGSGRSFDLVLPVPVPKTLRHTTFRPINSLLGAICSHFAARHDPTWPTSTHHLYG